MRTDFVYANEICHSKKPSASNHPLAQSTVYESELGECNNLEKLRRTSRRVEDNLARVAATITARDSDRLSHELVVIIRGRSTNQLLEFAGIDAVIQVPLDSFFQIRP